MSSFQPGNPATTSKNTSLSLEEFTRLGALLTAKTGILFPPHKQREVQLKISSLLEALHKSERKTFINNIEKSHDALQGIINKLTIGESYFFRNRSHFNALREKIIPELMKRKPPDRPLKIWSAGCSTGEEPYSLAILAKEHFPKNEEQHISITATDINTDFLSRAREAVYSKWSFRSVDQHIIDRYFSKEGPNRFRLNQDIVSRVDFSEFNLSQIPFTDRFAPNEFDLIICRNVLIYFSFEFSNKVVTALTETLKPNGYLVVGHAESFPALRNLDVTYSHATYYYRRSADQKEAQPKKPTLSIPGIGVHDIDRKSIIPHPIIPAPKKRTTPEASHNTPLGADTLEMAQEHADMGNIKQAHSILDSLLQTSEKLNYKAHFLGALIADQENRTSDAITHLRQAVFLNKIFTIGHYYYGIICEREGDKVTAGRCFRNVHRLTQKLSTNHVLQEGGGVTALQLREIVKERILELDL